MAGRERGSAQPERAAVRDSSSEGVASRPPQRQASWAALNRRLENGAGRARRAHVGVVKEDRYGGGGGPDLKVARMQCRQQVARRFERCPAASEPSRGKSQSRREASAISASRRTQRARAGASLGRRRATARQKKSLRGKRSPSCAIAIDAKRERSGVVEQATRFSARADQ